MKSTYWPKKLPEPPQIWFYCLATGNKEDSYLNKRQIVLQKKKEEEEQKLNKQQWKQALCFSKPVSSDGFKEAPGVGGPEPSSALAGLTVGPVFVLVPGASLCAS